FGRGWCAFGSAVRIRNRSSALSPLNFLRADWLRLRLKTSRSSDGGESLEGRKATGVAQPHLDRMFADVAVAAKHLDRVVGDLERRGRDIAAREIALLMRVLSAVEMPCGLPYQQARRVDLDRHVGQHEGDRLLCGDRHPE